MKRLSPHNDGSKSFQKQAVTYALSFSDRYVNTENSAKAFHPRDKDAFLNSNVSVSFGAGIQRGRAVKDSDDREHQDLSSFNMSFS